MKRMLLAAALATTTAMTIPTLARSADEGGTQQAQSAQTDEQSSDERGEPGRWMRGERGPERPAWRGMMMHRMMRRGDPKERCEERLARRAGWRAYMGAKLDLTPEQQPLWDKVQSAAQAEEQKERQLCGMLKEGGEPTLLDRLDRRQQFLSARLEGLQSAKPALQALYQALTPEQRAILDRPWRR
ncbi:MAG: Spy/CpxP family protein refolding chaperone [Alphaproteobacteria bacterium]|nr:Spy/CpxP family protein refolding chaperone [Alphaproteobacteria bacterium]